LSIPQSVAIPTELSQLDTQYHGVVVTTDVGFGLVIRLTLTLVVNNLNSLQFTTARTESSLSAISSTVLWYRLPMAGVPLPLGGEVISLTRRLRFTPRNISGIPFPRG
jgi:hypothetical protein